MDTQGLATIVDKGARVKKVDGQVIFPTFIFENKSGRDIWLGQLSISFQILRQHGNKKLIPSNGSNINDDLGSKYLLLKFKGNHSKHFLKLFLKYNSCYRLINCFDYDPKYTGGCQLMICK